MRTAASPRRVLVVDDDALTTELDSLALRAQGDEVEVANSMGGALRLLVETPHFDVLLTDLHIEGKGDGLLLAGVGKALHPGLVTHLVSGYPDIAAGLKAIESAVDEVMVKPTPLATLRERVELGRARPPGKMGRERLPTLLRAHHEVVVEAWLRAVEGDPQLALIKLDRSGRLDHVDELVLALSFRMEMPQLLGPESSEQAAQTAASRLHGKVRRAQGYQPIGMLREAAFLREVIGELIAEKFHLIDLSYFLRDILNLNQGLDAEIIESLSAWGLE